MKKFNNPTFTQKIGKPHDLWFVSIQVPYTVVKVNGQWMKAQVVQDSFLRSCEVVLPGGYVNEISDELAAELTAAGYGDCISEG